MALFIRAKRTPQKGDLVDINMTGSGTAQTFRVLKNVSGTTFEVIAMSDARTALAFASYQHNVYAEETLDTYLNTTWYNTLSNTAKLAIVDKTFRQDWWYYGTQGNPDYQGKSRTDTAYQVSLEGNSQGVEITRHCYAISLQDVIDYLGVTPEMTQTDTTLTNDNIWQMFWNDNVSHLGKLIWLRSANVNTHTAAFIVDGNYGSIERSRADLGRCVRPAFQIDLSKINYTFTDGQTLGDRLVPINILQKVDNALRRAKVEYTVPKPTYITFSSPSNFNLQINSHTKNWDGTIYYSMDKITWYTWNGQTTIYSAQDENQYVLYMRGSNNSVITGQTDGATSGTSGYWARWIFSGNANISCSGNIENLLDYETVKARNHPIMADYCFNSMFCNCTNLITTPELPATTLSSHCYEKMFDSCRNLATASELPATTLADYCYNGMFSGCTSLTTAPSLPATTLASYCYEFMFSGCQSLTTIPALPATTLADYCYWNMFGSCTSLTITPELPATTLANYCYATMFQNCTSLTTAPQLPATTLMNNCYYEMFKGCTALTIPAKIVEGTTQTTSAKQCCYRMYYGCTSLNIYTSSSGHTAFYKATTYSTDSSAINYQSTYRMFYNCKIDGVTSTDNYLTAGTQYYY